MKCIQNLRKLATGGLPHEVIVLPNGLELLGLADSIPRLLLDAVDNADSVLQARRGRRSQGSHRTLGGCSLNLLDFEKRTCQNV